MITDTGGNLSVVIMTKPKLGWQTFSTWYSFYKNLPDAQITVNCLRDGETPFNYYQWCKRLKILTFRHKALTEDCEQANWLDSIRQSKLALGENVLIVRPLTLATDLIDADSLKRMNQDMWMDDDAWLLRKSDVDKMLNDIFMLGVKLPKDAEKLCFEAKEQEEPKWLISHNKGCGKWIHSARGCPFSNAAGLVTADMTANEHRIIELWKKMVPLYTVVS
jgi:hypothetical protein